MKELEKRKEPQFKSERRHGLKMIDKKWAPSLVAGKAMKQKLEVANKMLKNK